jgi:hypothetical protein
VKPLRADDPDVIGDYRILGTLGAGGMGRVYLARSRGGRTVAVKVIRPEHADNPVFRRRFRREVEAARRVTGSWTAPVLDADPDAESPYLVTAYVPGPSLAEAVLARGPLPTHTLRALGAGLAEALLEIHRAGLVHRDLKPSNVLLSLDGPRVIDFGIARALDSTALTRTGAAIGSPAFMSPEQINGVEALPATDVFALGGLLVFAATGAGPFDGPTIPAVMNNVLNREPALDSLPADLRPLAAACLSKAPGTRPGPDAVRAALAPGGAAALIEADWLPPDLVASLSRRAVALLDLEAPVVPPGAASPAVGQEPTPDPTPAGATTAAVPGPGHPGAWPPPAVPGPGHPAAWPSPAVPPPAGVGPRTGARRRRNGLITVLAAVLAVLVVGGIVGYLVARGDGNAGPTVTSSLVAEPTALAAEPGAGPASTGGADAPTPGPLPAGYVGTWVGQVRSELGLVQDVVLTLRAGNSGETLGHSEYSVSEVTGLDGEPVRCLGDQRLVGLTPGGDVVLADVPGAESNPALFGVQVCTAGGTTRLRLGSDGRLSIVVADPGAGQPTGTLTRRA